LLVIIGGMKVRYVIIFQERKSFRMNPDRESRRGGAVFTLFSSAKLALSITSTQPIPGTD